MALSCRQTADTADQRIQVFAIEVLHGNEVEAIDHADVVDPADVGVRDLAGNADFVAEPGESRFRHLGAGEEFEGDGLVEDEVEGAVDLAHAAVAEEAEDAIAAGEDCAGGEAAFVDGGGGRRGLLEEGLGGVIERGEAGGTDAPTVAHLLRALGA
jgi:hypothetical protein